MPTLVSSGDITISDINDGLSAQLSKESHIVPTDSDGSNPDFTGCQTTISIFLGSIDDSLNWTIIATPSAGLTGSLNVRTYTVTALTGSVGYVDLTASKVGFPSITARFTVTKLADGANGTRIAVLEMYQWAASAPTSFPDGTSTYTWATGTFTAPTTPNGWTLIPGAPVSGQTLWGISVVVSNTETTPQSIVDWDSNVVYAVGAAGSNGAPGTAYWLTSSVPAVQKSIAGVYTPTSITYNLIQAIGSSAPTAYAGRFIIATSTDGSAYTNVYTSATIESSKSYIVPASIKTIRVRAYLTDGATLVDELITTIVSDGATGATGTTGARGLNFSEAKILYTDLTFQTGVNGISVYNNSGGGTVTHTRVARLADSPFTDSNFNLEISNTGVASPGLGGFTHSTQTRASAIFVQRFIAKVPVGYTLSYHNNAFGTGATASWLTSNAGTGTFQEYIVEWRCGSTGTFSSISFIALNGAVGTPEVPVKWWLASSTVYDFTAIGFATTIGVLSNESHTIPTDSSGNNGNFTGASTTITIYNGTVNDSANWAVTASPVNVTGTLVGKTYTVTALSADTGYVDLTATRSGFTNIVKRFSLTKSRAGVNGTDGVNGTRTAVLDVYRWSATTPTTFPSGTSTYTWATGQFTAPATLNGWSLTPPAPVLGQTLWSLRQLYADTGVSTTSSITWSANTPTSLSAAGTNGSNGSNGTRTAILELYRWSATTPTTFPSGTSTYTWATGAFTAPATLNSWSLLPGASVPGQTLWGCSVAYSDQLTTTTSSVTWNTSTAYAVGAAGSNALQISVVATQWDYRDDDAIWGIKINDVLQAGAARGHKLVVLNPATGVVSINQNYDTYGSEANTDSLATAINNVVDGQIVILTTFDATQCNQNLRNALRLCGSESVETWTAQRKSHAFIGQKGLPIGAAYEKTGFGTTATGTSKVAAYFTTSGIVRNGSTAFNAVSAILSNEAHVFPASTSGVVSSYVGSGTEIRVYDGTTPLTYDGSGTLPGTWKIATVPTNITIGTITDSGSFATIADHSGVAEGIDTAAIIYTITGKSIINGDFTLVKVQTFSKAKRGIEGNNAISVSLSNESHVLPATYNNSVSNYSNSGTEIQVFEGSNELLYDAVGATAGTWKVDVKATNIAAGPVKKFVLGEDWVFDEAMGGAGWGTTTITCITWANNLFIIGGLNGKVATSPDGVNWIVNENLTKTGWGKSVVFDIIWTGTQYVAIGADGVDFASAISGSAIAAATTIATSIDAITWEYQPDLNEKVKNIQYAKGAYSIAWSGSKFVVGNNVGVTSTSLDAATWTVSSNLSETNWRSLVSGSYTTVVDVNWNGSQFLAVGPIGRVATSPDGITWTYQFGLLASGWGTYTDVVAVNWNGSQYLVVGYSGSIATSPDGVTWTNQAGLRATAWGTSNICAINWNGSQYVIVGASGKVATSPDGITWANQTGLSTTAWGTSTVYAVNWNGNFYVVGGAGGKVATSPDGVTWTYHTGLIDTDKWLDSPINSGSMLDRNAIIGGNDGKFATRINNAWEFQDAFRIDRTTIDFYSINWSGFQYLVGNSTGNVATSPDGITWTYQTGLSASGWGTSIIYAINWNGSQYVIVGASGKVATSPDGVTWTYQSGLSSTTWGTSTVYDINWNGSQYVVVGASGKVATSPDGITWAYQSGLSSTTWGTGAANSICWDNTKYIVAGADGKIATSSDGITWTYQAGLRATSWGTTADINIIIWNGSQFFVAGTSGKVATSLDAINWTNQTGLSSTAWGTTTVFSSSWNGSQYVVCGSDGDIATSPDGITWAFQTGLSTTMWGADDYVRDIIWDGTRFLAVGDGSKLATSVNGISWSYSPSLRGWETIASDIRHISNIDNTIYVLGQNGNIACSSDLLNWAHLAPTGSVDISSETLIGIAKSDTTLCIVGLNNVVLTGPDNQNLAKQVGIANSTYDAFYDGSDAIEGINWNGSQYVVVGGYGDVATSPDGITWTYRAGLTNTTWGTSVPWGGINWNGSQYLTAGADGKVATSPDGITWTYQSGLSSTTFGASTVWAINWNGSQYLVAGSNGRIATSPDGVIWTYQGSLTSTAWGFSTVYAVNWNGSQYIAVGSNGNVATSSDGSTWTYQVGLSSTAWGTSIVYDVHWNGTQYIAVGGSGKVATSANGITWTYQAGLSSTDWGIYNVRKITWNGSLYLVAGRNGMTATSPDGITWTSISVAENDVPDYTFLDYCYYDGTRFILAGWGELWFSTIGDTSFLYPTWTINLGLLAGNEWNRYSYIKSIAWGNGIFCAVGEYGRIATSPDGITWTYRQLSNSTWLSSTINQIIFANGIFCIIGNYGKTATSIDGINWQIDISLTNTDWGKNPINSIIWNNGKFHIFGYNGKTAYSTDGLSWQFTDKIRTSDWGTENDIFCSFGNDEIIYAGGTDGLIVYSDNFVGIEKHSDFNNGADSAIINYLITGYSSTNEYFSIKKAQTLSKAKTGNIATATFGVNITGQITADNAGTYIANQTINTPQIAGSAVTVPASAYTAAAFTLSTSFQVLQSVVIDLQSDIPIPVIVTSSFTLSGATVSQFRILRGTTVLFTSGEIIQGTDGINKPTSPISIAIGDTAPIGTSTYYLEARYVSGFTARTAATRNLTILGVKK